ncbi:MAG: aspartate aminotransferase [Candidatus Goldiibacteriota bacterium HGW-Goldbacteria-1]|jgi:aspartate aminotransferase|nr:MAG: aspartate aminotransferase [Candidatus Goldiibacteriota bacterium HGW-Goldbacteria-1]
MIADRMKKVQASITLAIDAKAKQMIAEGVDLVGFGAGEPDFNTPDNIKVAGIKAIVDNKTKYTPSSGMPDLKNPIAKKLLEDNKLEYKPSNIIVSCGAKHSLYNIFMAGINPGDEVIIFSPYWVSYVEMVNMAQGIPVLVQLDESKKFEIDFELLKSKITKNTKMMIINSPSNPTGCVLSKSSLEKLAEICLANNILMISDEIYEKNLYNGKTHISIASLSKEAKAKTVVVNGVSKSHAMTGWRIGYIAADDMELVKAMDNMQSHSTSNPTTISQMAAIEALKTDSAIVNKMVAEFDKRRKYILQRVNAISGLTCVEPEGAFYVFPNFSSLVGKTFNGVKIENSMNLADALLTSAKVAVVPGVAFGSDVHFRMSYATSMEKIEKGLNRIEEFFKG